jgi:hypothetical protein
MNLESEENLSRKEFKHSIIKQNEKLLNTHLCSQTDRCPECGERIYREGGCPICIFCGWSPCG